MNPKTKVEVLVRSSDVAVNVKDVNEVLNEIEGSVLVLVYQDFDFCMLVCIRVNLK